MDSFECKVKYERDAQDGHIEKVAEAYLLLDVLSFTEAESRLTEHLKPYMSGEYQVSDIRRVRYTEFFSDSRESADKFFKCKLVFITLDEKSGKEKKTSTQVLVQAADLPAALVRLQEGMQGTMGDYTIASITETALMDVIRLGE